MEPYSTPACRDERECSKTVKVKVKVQVFDTPQVVNCFKVESDAAFRLLPS